MAISLRLRERIRAFTITGLIIVSLIMVGMLSHQTYVAVTSQKKLVADVLRDYSSLAAEEFMRRSAAVAVYGFYPMLGRLAQFPADSPLPDQKAFSMIADEDDEEDLAEAARLARGFFRYLPGGGRLTQTGEALPDFVVKKLHEDLRHLDAVSEPREIVRTSHVKADGEHYNLIYAMVGAGELEDRFVVGLWIDNEVAIEWLRFFVNASPLLPGSLTDGKLENESVFVNLMMGTDTVYSQGEYREGSLIVGREFTDDATTVFGGMSLKLGIDPNVADSLIIGGLPESRYPLLYGRMGSLWLLAVLLMIVALILLHRERSLAQLRSDFVSRVSHELRTPLTQIMMFAQTLLLDRVRNEDERRQSLKMIDKEAQRLSRLVDNILQFSRAERGQTEISLVRQPLCPLVREIAEQFRPMMNEGRLIVTSDVSDDVEVQLDVNAFRQMFVNLLDNAVKFSPTGENVDITLSESDGKISVAVEDRGPGVPEEEMARIWEPYYRTPQAAQKAVGGTGIGLAVVNELARLQTAYVSSSERSGGGARFVIGFDIVGGTA